MEAEQWEHLHSKQPANIWSRDYFLCFTAKLQRSWAEETPPPPSISQATLTVRLRHSKYHTVQSQGNASLRGNKLASAPLVRLITRASAGFHMSTSTERDTDTGLGPALISTGCFPGRTLLLHIYLMFCLRYNRRFARRCPLFTLYTHLIRGKSIFDSYIWRYQFVVPTAFCQVLRYMTKHADDLDARTVQHTASSLGIHLLYGCYIKIAIYEWGMLTNHNLNWLQLHVHYENHKCRLNVPVSRHVKLETFPDLQS